MSAAKLTGNRCACPTCGERFNGLAGFDAHRVGRFDRGRRCLTVAEMTARGWCRNGAGFWVTDSGAQRAARRSAAGIPARRTDGAMHPHRVDRAAPERVATA